MLLVVTSSLAEPVVLADLIWPCAECTGDWPAAAGFPPENPECNGDPLVAA